MSTEASKFQVSARIKPEILYEAAFDVDGTSLRSKVEPGSDYTLDTVFTGAASQSDVSHEIITKSVNEHLDGENGTIMVHGASGTGKTYTMWGHCGPTVTECSGLVPRYLERLFQKIEGVECKVAVRYVEIYNERVMDLLSSVTASEARRISTDKRLVNPHDLKVIKSNKTRFSEVYGAKKRVVSCYEDAIGCLSVANERRRTAKTLLCGNSSRGHTILTVYIFNQDSNLHKCSKFNFVDLAGSENLRKSGAADKGMGPKNCSLLELSRVLKAEVLNRRNNSSPSHVSYRGSKLARILEDSLSGGTRVYMVVTVSLNVYNHRATMSALEYAVDAMQIRNTPRDIIMGEQSLPAPHYHEEEEDSFPEYDYEQAHAVVSNLKLSNKFQISLHDYEDLLKSYFAQIKTLFTQQLETCKIEEEDWTGRLMPRFMDIETINSPNLLPEVHNRTRALLFDYKIEVEGILYSLNSLFCHIPSDQSLHASPELAEDPQFTGLRIKNQIDILYSNAICKINEFQQSYMALESPESTMDSAVNELLAQLSAVGESVKTSFDKHEQYYYEVLTRIQRINALKHCLNTSLQNAHNVFSEGIKQIESLDFNLVQYEVQEEVVNREHSEYLDESLCQEQFEPLDASIGMPNSFSINRGRERLSAFGSPLTSSRIDTSLPVTSQSTPLIGMSRSSLNSVQNMHEPLNVHSPPHLQVPAQQDREPSISSSILKRKRSSQVSDSMISLGTPCPKRPGHSRRYL